MIKMSHDEASLFRILTSFFGADQVIYNMSVMAVCGGQLPDNITATPNSPFSPALILNGNGRTSNKESISSLVSWARKNKCLFTIVNQGDQPCMVIEFFSGFEKSIDLREEEHQRLLRPILKAQGINYVTISPSEFAEILDPSSSLDFFSFMKSKVEPSCPVV